MFLKKIAKTIAISKANRELRQQRGWAIDAFNKYEANGSMKMRQIMLTGAIVCDNEIADNCRQIRDIWGIDF